MLTVYQHRTSVRVVLGEHSPHKGSDSYRVAVYGNESTAPAVAARLALANETDESVRAAILRIVPDAERSDVAPPANLPPRYEYLLKAAAKVVGKSPADLMNAMGRVYDYVPVSELASALHVAGRITRAQYAHFYDFGFEFAD